VINFDDYARIDNGFNNAGDEWFEGDFDLNGLVNFDDYALIDLAFNTQATPRATPVPESTMVAFGGAMFVAIICARRRQFLSGQLAAP
jgi:hypothetical protein